MIKLALTGYAGAGKDWVAKKIREKYGQDNSARFAFADELKKDLFRLLGLNKEQWELMLYSEEFKQGQYMCFDDYRLHTIMEVKDKYNIQTAASLTKLTDGPKENMAIQLRELLVYYGTNVMQAKMGKNVWVGKVFNSEKYKEAVNSGKLITITDTRFPQEYKECKKRGFEIIKVVRENSLGIKNEAETYIEQFKVDYVFKNYENPEKFKEELDKLFKYYDSKLY